VQPYIFLDAGWTLVFPDYPLLGQVARQHGYEIAQPFWERAVAEFARDYDEAIKNGEDRWGVLYFLQWTLRRLGVQGEDANAIAREVEKHDREKSLWCYVYPWAHRTLESLTSQGYRLSVISNADGRVKQGFQELGLARYFEEIFDSRIVGYQKPDVRLFQHAMSTLGLEPSGCLYVGDLYYVDVLGANRAEIAAIHLDPYDLYSGLPGIHIPSMAALPEYLGQGWDLQREEFFPLRQ
jgi:HAD superfamily hydrolase (TIGR01549 family)